MPQLLNYINEFRQVPINDDLEEVFKSIRKEKQLRSEYVFTYQQNEDKLAGIEAINRHGKSKPVLMPVKNVRRAFRSALTRAGIDDFRFHDLRHTFASHFIMRGGSLKELQEILGHKDIKMTMRYAHLSQEHKKKAVNRLNGLTASVKSDMSQNCHISDSPSLTAL